MDDFEDDDYRQIVSRVLDTDNGGQAWLEQDTTGQVYARCSGCRGSWPMAGMAPGLLLLTHLVRCEM